MFALKVNKYDSVKSMFAEIPGCPWQIAVMQEENLGRVYVDNLLSPQTAYIETPYFMYYLGGAFNKSFLDNVINHISSNIIPDCEEKLVFIFSSNQQWKDEIEACLKPYGIPHFGSYLTRRLYHLNKAAYIKFKETCKSLPDEYIIELQRENDEAVTVKALFNGMQSKSL